MFFGLWIAQLTLLHAERDWVVPLLRVTLAAYLYLLAMDAGWLPRWFFT